jgi:tRNA threonylcarbamoyladenosine biosynthesis protein TsaE
MNKMIELKTEQDTLDLAAFIAPLLRPGDVLLLHGNLGSGKTFFASALGRHLGIAEFLDSPSFVLLKEYHEGRWPLYHLDLYRLKSEEELLDLGLFDILESGITLIEWPELALKLLPERVLNLSLHFSFDGSQRKVEIVAKDRFSAYFN